MSDQRRIVIGTNVTRGGTPAELLVDVLLRTRLLVQASSGGGKSWLLRLLCEALRRLGVMVVVLDPEGEFSSLREKFDFVVAGVGGDLIVSPEAAGTFARKLLKRGASAVCDLFEMVPQQRKEWVKNFLLAMVDAPKDLWRECVVILDESHIFCPEKGHGEAVSSEAVMALATRGRKRGYCLIPATQRLSKLHKDVAAECGNIMIGPTTLDLDRQRAADNLGVARDDLRRFMADVKMLKPGSFYSLGRALSTDMVLVSVGKVETTHPEPGAVYSVPDAAPASTLKDILEDLEDLPRAAAMELSDVEALKVRVRELEKLLGKKGINADSAKPVVKEVVRLPQGTVEELVRLEDEATAIWSKLSAVAKGLSLLTSACRAIETDPKLKVMDVVSKYPPELYLDSDVPRYPGGTPIGGQTLAVLAAADRVKEYTKRDAELTLSMVRKLDAQKMSGNESGLNSGQRRLLATVHLLGETDRATAALMSGMEPTGWTARKYFSVLVGKKLVRAETGSVVSNLNDEQLRKLLGQDPKDLTATQPAYLLGEWKERLAGKKKNILDFAAHETAPDRPLSRKAIAQGAGFGDEWEGWTFRKYFGELMGAGLFIRKKGGYHVHPALMVKR